MNVLLCSFWLFTGSSLRLCDILDMTWVPPSVKTLFPHFIICQKKWHDEKFSSGEEKNICSSNLKEQRSHHSPKTREQINQRYAKCN